IYKVILNFIGLHLKTEINEALATNSKHHRSPYISTTFMRFPCSATLEEIHPSLTARCIHSSFIAFSSEANNHLSMFVTPFVKQPNAQLRCEARSQNIQFDHRNH
ncbi:hypothetical protein, partial [Vibrio cholerae]|uniref:hypothetical protein n=1 Tax=Vibrio cholerae TaxID=666 RepID=UPI003080F0EF